jgi:hypothetical protein
MYLLLHEWLCALFAKQSLGEAFWLALFAWILSKGDNNPWRCLMAKRQRFTKEFKARRSHSGNRPLWLAQRN